MHTFDWLNPDSLKYNLISDALNKPLRIPVSSSNGASVFLTDDPYGAEMQSFTESALPSAEGVNGE